MRIAGIIAEYNPLHRGHAYHIEMTRKQSDLVVVAMSGSFVQRGEIAAFDKFLRANWAIAAGADLVLELPAVYCLQAAPGFAAGGVKILAAAGVSAISFGSEQANLELLERAADLLCEENDETHAAIRKAMKAGQSYPRARHAAHKQASDEVLAALEKPNFLLGVEYIRAIRQQAAGLESIVIERRGDAHDAPASQSDFLSASAIRDLIGKGQVERAESALPSFVAEELEKHSAATLDDLENVILYKLRSLSQEEAVSIFGASEGLENLILKAAEMASLKEALFFCKSKRYTLARIRRLFCAALLGLKASVVERANAAPAPYLRVLAFGPNAQPLLRKLSDRDTPPLLQKKRDFDRLDGLSAELFSLDRRATDIQALAFRDPALRSGARDLTRGTLGALPPSRGYVEGSAPKPPPKGLAP